ncbi:BhlA/UviB family holin-like peptide [Clostridium lacusfryxellense]|uniref:BhlA/UviB family holin-like peptide n=1 Tax=Clostridium lacusfryxellense TaxID=205328 RepID=UPI001C0DE8F7|nr:BhlA/UviB family holin-like peptide [Clostridium lacusfryxellense]MBU3112117.1 UviB-like protein [Clostridium lacusfryxellense]
MEVIIAKALSEGLGYALFVWLLLYILKQQKDRDLKQDARDEKSGEREKTYQQVILELTKNFEMINNISGVVENIKLKVEELLKKDNK